MAITPVPATTSTPSPSSVVLRNANGTPNYAGAGYTSSNYVAGGTSPSLGAASKPVAGTNVGTLSANISTPASSTNTRPAPVVVTSQPAQTDLANKQQQIQQFNADTQNHQTLVSAPITPPATGAESDTSSSTQTSPTTTPDTSGSDSLGTHLDSQISTILSGLNSSTQTIEDTAKETGDTYATEAATAQAALDSQASVSLAKLSQIASGTYPLSPAEQNILNATTEGFQSAIQYQTVANQAYTGQMTEAMASLGINTSAPTEAMGMIHSAISAGATKITDINSQMAIALGNLQIGFQKQDYSMVSDAWTATASYLENRVSTLTTMQKNVIDAAHQQVTDMQTQAKTNLDAVVQSSQFSLSEKQDTIDNAFKQQQITETQRHDLITEATEAETAAYGRYQYDATTGTLFDKATGKTTMAGMDGAGFAGATPGQTGNPLIDGNTKTTSTGVHYIDGTNLTGKQAQMATIAAGQMGVTYLGKDGAAAVNKLEEARTNLANIKDVLQGTGGGSPISPGNGFERAIDIPTFAAEGATQIGSNSTQIAAYNTFRSAAISALQAVAGGTGSGLRINQAEILMSIKNDIPQLTDTTAVRDQKLANMTSLLDSNESQILGSSSTGQSSNSNPLSLPTPSSSVSNTTPSANNQLGI